MAKRHTNHMTAKVWTPTMSSEFSGTPDGCIPMAFYALDTKARREKCIAELQKIHGALSAREDRDALDEATPP